MTNEVELVITEGEEKTRNVQADYMQIVRECSQAVQAGYHGEIYIDGLGGELDEEIFYAINGQRWIEGVWTNIDADQQLLAARFATWIDEKEYAHAATALWKENPGLHEQGSDVKWRFFAYLLTQAVKTDVGVLATDIVTDLAGPDLPHHWIDWDVVEAEVEKVYTLFDEWTIKTEILALGEAPESFKW